MKESLSRNLAKGTVSVLNAFLRVDANSTSCIIVHQPKVPKELEKFRRKK